MSDLRPLLESSDDELELALLGSVRAELPRPSALRDTALALGLASSTASALAATLPVPSAVASLTANAVSVAAPLGSSGSALVTSSAGAGAATAGLSGAVGAAGAASLGVLGKGLLAGALVSFLALNAVDRTLGTSSHRAPSASPAPSPVQRVERPAQGPTEQGAAVVAPPTVTGDAQPVPEPSPSPAPVSHGGGRRASSPLAGVAPIAEPPPSNAPAPTNAAFEPVPPATPTALADASLAAEIRLLDQARAALAAGQLDRASRLLDAHAADRPSSVLAQEAALLRVRLLLARGQRSAATELARRIIAQHPESAHVDSLRRLAAEP